MVDLHSDKDILTEKSVCQRFQEPHALPPSSFGLKKASPSACARSKLQRLPSSYHSLSARRYEICPYPEQLHFFARLPKPLIAPAAAHHGARQAAEARCKAQPEEFNEKKHRFGWLIGPPETRSPPVVWTGETCKCFTLFNYFKEEL